MAPFTSKRQSHSDRVAKSKYLPRTFITAQRYRTQPEPVIGNGWRRRRARRRSRLSILLGGFQPRSGGLRRRWDDSCALGGVRVNCTISGTGQRAEGCESFVDVAICAVSVLTRLQRFAFALLVLPRRVRRTDAHAPNLRRHRGTSGTRIAALKRVIFSLQRLPHLTLHVLTLYQAILNSLTSHAVHRGPFAVGSTHPS